MVRSKTSHRLHRAVHIVLSTTLDLNLDRRVTDTKVVAQFFVHRTKHLLTASDALFSNHYVATTTDDTGAHSPDVEVMNSQHAVDTANGLLHFRHGYACRYAFEQYTDALL